MSAAVDAGQRSQQVGLAYIADDDHIQQSILNVSLGRDEHTAAAVLAVAHDDGAHLALFRLAIDFNGQFTVAVGYQGGEQTHEV